MDHVIARIQMDLETELEILAGEWKSGVYKKFSDCPSYPSAKALVQAIHVLEKCYYGEKRTMTVREWINFYM